MPTLKRFLAENQCYHTISATLNRQAVFSDRQNAEELLNCIKNISTSRAYVLAYAVMPDHLHLVLVPNHPFTLPQVMQSIKGYSSRAINSRLGRRGSIWQSSYFDRVIRTEEHLRQTVAYVEHNPVSAGLVEQAEDYPYSSAHHTAVVGIEAWVN